MTNVFVKTDLVYLAMTTAELNEASPKLIPLIAHDRAGFGGALFCDAIAILIIALWGSGKGAVGMVDLVDWRRTRLLCRIQRTLWNRLC